MALIYKDGKIEDLDTTHIKLPKSFIKRVDNNIESKQTIKQAKETIKKAKVVYGF
jgi:hypothetical protein